MTITEFRKYFYPTALVCTAVALVLDLLSKDIYWAAYSAGLTGYFLARVLVEFER